VLEQFKNLKTSRVVYPHVFYILSCQQKSNPFDETVPLNCPKVCALGRDPKYVCWKSSGGKGGGEGGALAGAGGAGAGAEPVGRGGAGGGGGGEASSDEEEEEEDDPGGQREDNGRRFKKKYC
jgi:hypothetical protein